MVYRNTLTEGLVVHVMYTYCQSYCGIQGYSDKVHIGTNIRGNCDIWYISWPSSVSMELHVQL